MFSLDPRVSSSNWTISSEAQSICEEAKKAALQKGGQKVWGASIKILIGPSIKIWYPEHPRPGRMYQVRLQEKPYCELDDDLVRHCSSISEHNARNPTIDLSDEIWRSVGRNLTICRQKSGNLLEEIAALLGSSYLPGYFRISTQRWTLNIWQSWQSNDQGLDNLWPNLSVKIFVFSTLQFVLLLLAGSRVCQAYGNDIESWSIFDLCICAYVYFFSCVFVFLLVAWQLGLWNASCVFYDRLVQRAVVQRISWSNLFICNFVFSNCSP